MLGLDGSPLVNAIVAASEGSRVDLPDEMVRRHFGCRAEKLPDTPRRTIVVRAGGRGGKTSRLLAPKALHAAWTVPLPTLAAGESAVAMITAPDLRLARQTLSFVTGYVKASPVLRAALVGEPKAESVTLRRPDGKTVRIETLAASGGGRAQRARTLVFAGLDEACFFRGESAAVNDVEIYRAVIQRIVPGGQCWIVSTPWIAGQGLLEKMFADNFGVHENALCVTAPTRALNPTWDPDGSIEASMRAEDPDNADREIGAIPLSSVAASFFAPEAIKQSTRAAPERIQHRSGATYGAGGDFAFRRDSSAIAIVELRIVKGVEQYALAAFDEQRPADGLPLTADGVLDAFCPLLADYQLGAMAADSHEREQVESAATARNIAIADAPAGQPGKAETYSFVRRILHEGRLSIPDNPRLIAQLKGIVSKPAPGGGITITSPRAATGGHGDIVSALVLAVWMAHRSHELGDDDLRPRLLSPGRRGTWD